jgi:hypothetical protein
MVTTQCDDEDVRVTLDGRVEFTASGREFYTSYFGYAGIDIRRIQTREDLYRARRQAFPYFFAFMEQRLKKRRQTLEIRALLAIIRDDSDAITRIGAQLKTRERLSLVSGSSVEPPSPRESP